MATLRKTNGMNRRRNGERFDWEDATGATEKIEEELAELKEAVAAGDKAMMAEEMGDLLFSAVNYCRFLDVDAESALGRSDVELHGARWASSRPTR